MIAFIERLSAAAGVVATVFIALAILIVCELVFVRYALNGSAAWQTEVVTFLLVAATLLGSAWVFKERGHVAVGLVTAYAAPAAQRVMLLLSDFIVLLFAAFAAWKGAAYAWEAWEGEWTTESIYEFQLWLPLSSLPIGFGLLALQALACMLKTLRGDDVTIARGH